MHRINVGIYFRDFLRDFKVLERVLHLDGMGDNCKAEFDWSNYLSMETIEFLSGAKRTKTI